MIKMYCSLAKYNTTTKSVDWFPFITQGKQTIEITDKVRNCLTDLNLEQIKTIPNLTKLIDSYETGEPKVLDFAQGIRDGSIQLKDGQTMLQGYQSYLKSTSTSLTLADLKTKALSVSMKVLSTIGWMAAFTAATWVISKAAEGVDNWIHRVEKANDAMDSAVDEYKTVQSELESTNTELENQEKRIDELLAKDKLTYVEKGELEELQKITKELLIQQDIETKRAERMSKEAAQKTVDAYNTQYGDHDITKEDLQDKFDHVETTGIFPLAEDKNDVTGNIAAYIRATELLTEAQEKYNKAVENNEDTHWLEDDVQFYIDMISSYEEQIENNISDLQEKRISLEEEYSKAIEKSTIGTSPLTTDEKETIETYKSIVNAIRLIYEYTNQSDWNNMEIDSIFNTKEIEKTKDELIDMAKSGVLTPETIVSYKNLNGAIENSEIFLKNGQTAAQAFCNEIYACAEAKDDLDSGNGDKLPIFNDIFSLKDADNNATVLSGLKDQLSEVESAYKTCLSAKEEYDEQGYLSVDTLEKVLSLGDEYLQYLFDEEGNVRLDVDAFQELAQARINNLEAQALSNLAENIKQVTDEATATDYLAQKQNDLAKSYADVAANALMAMSSIDGFSNSKPLQDAYTSFKAQYDQIKGLFANTKKGLSATYNKKSSASKSSSDPLKDAFTAEYNTLKHNLEMEYITEKDYYDSLAMLNNKYFAGKTAYLDEYRKYEEEVYKGLQSYYKDYIESQIDLLEKQLDAGIINYQHYSSTVKSLLDNMYSDGKVSAADYYSYTEKMLNKQKDFYDDVLSAVTRRLDVEIDKWQTLIDNVKKENDALEKQKDNYDAVISAIKKVIQSKKDEVQNTIDALEEENDKIQEQVDNYDSVLRAVDKVYDAEIKSLQDQQAAIDDKIKALREANDEEKRGIELEKAKAELARAQTQRTKYTFNGEQFVYTTDNEAIRDAKEKVSDLELEQTISDMEKEKEALQETIDKLDEYRQKWSEIADAYQNAMDKNIAQNILGQDYDQTVLLNRIEDIEAFKERYVNAQTQMDDNTSMIESYQEKLLYYDSLSEKWSSIATLHEEAVNRELAAQILGADWEHQILEGRVITFDEFKNQYLAIQDQIEDNTGLIASYEEKIIYYQNLKDQWSSISDAYKNSMEDQKAAMLLGADWEEKITSGRLDVLNNFRNEYIATQKAIAEAAWNSANEQIRAAKEAEKGAKGNTGSAGTIGDSKKTTDKYKVVDTNGQTISSGLNYKDANNMISASGKQDQWEIKKFSKGGLITGIQKNPLNRYASLLGEDQIIGVQNGERVLTPQQNDSWEELTKHLPDFLSITKFMPNFNIPTYDMVPIAKEEPLSFSIGEIHVHEVRNPDAFAETLIRELPNKMLQALNRRRM